MFRTVHCSAYCPRYAGGLFPALLMKGEEEIPSYGTVSSSPVLPVVHIVFPMILPDGPEAERLIVGCGYQPFSEKFFEFFDEFFPS